MTAMELLERNRGAIEELCRRFGVIKLMLFGSAARGEWDPATSDLDFLADFGPLPPGIDLFAQQFVFQVEMERLLGCPVDIVERKAIRRPVFLAQATTGAVTWYAA